MSATDPLLPKKEASKPEQQVTISTQHLDPEEAETHNLQTLERQAAGDNRQRLGSVNQAQYDQIHNMFQSNSPPPVVKRDFSESSSKSTSSPPVFPKQKAGHEEKRPPRMLSAVRKVQMMNKLKTMKSVKGNLGSVISSEISHLSPNQRSLHPKQQASRAHELISSIFDDQEQQSSGLHDPKHLGAVYVAAGIDKDGHHREEIDEDDVFADLSESEDEDNDVLPSVYAPTTPSPTRPQEYGSVPSSPELSRHQRRHRRKKTCLARFLRSLLRVWHFVAARFYPCVVCSYVSYIALPLFALAWALYYYLGNPEFDFMPGHATLSWWCNFMGRQVITLELARLTHWMVLDVVVLTSRFAARFLGPIVTMTAVESRGWPFIVACWGAWDLVLLHGDNTFQTHWFYWTGLRIYSVANSGSYMLNSHQYLGILIAMIVAGLATTAKRMFLSIRFGRRILVMFKPRMEQLLAEMVLMEEMTELGENAEAIAQMLSSDDAGSEDAKANISDFVTSMGKKQQAKTLAWENVANYEEDASENQNEDVLAAADPEPIMETPSTESMRSLSRTGSGSFLLKKQLEMWEDPVNPTDKDEFSVQDILKFRHALAYLDDEYPCGEAFGSVRTRDRCIAASHRLYWKLVKCLPGSTCINFDVLGLVAAEEDGTRDENKLKLVRKLFQPDANNELNLLAFVQSVDHIYKRARYLKSAYQNASAIDLELERILNILFYFVLTLILLSIMNFNPWPLLVSITSLLVSISFALGSSVSKYVEGVLLIAVRRPFDLGDRILLCGPEGNDTPGANSSWFVEDIRLFSTTIRYARTNEVSTVNNYSISLSRIVNCNRSANAIVVLELKFSILILEGDKLKAFREALEKYVTENPRIWDSLLFCRHDFFHPDVTEEFVFFTIAFKHRQSWQSAARININRADLLRYIFELGKKLEIQYNTPPSRRLLVPPQSFRSLSAPNGLRQDSLGFDPMALSGPMDSDRSLPVGQVQEASETGAASLAPAAD